MGDTETILAVRGMTCGACVRHVEQALRTVSGVIAVRVHLERGEARVSHVPGTPAWALIEAVERAGYGGEVGPTSAPAV